jgi:hypothetical protein
MEERLNRIRTAMDKPDFAFCFKGALLQAARTDSGDKHAILARLVTERLANDGDSLLPIVVQQACECMGLLTSSHICILALCSWGWFLSDEYHRMLHTIDATTFEMEFMPTIRKLAPASEVGRDAFLYLDDVSCLRITADTNALHVTPLFGKQRRHESDGIRELIVHLKDRMLCSLTCKGLVIGTCAYDALTGSTTDLRRVLD